MSRTHIQHIELLKWFPKDDPVATCVARLCILREDLYLEFEGLGPEGIKALDLNSLVWRRTYFFRSLSKTLSEIDSTFTTLNRQKSFREALKKQPKIIQQKYRTLLRRLREVHESIKEMRNKLGGHVNNSAVTKALNLMGLESKGLIEFGSTIGKTHYRFTTELVLGILLVDSPDTDKIKAIDKKIKEVLGLTASVLVVTGDIVWLYITSRGLHR